MKNIINKIKNFFYEKKEEIYCLKEDSEQKKIEQKIIDKKKLEQHFLNEKGEKRIQELLSLIKIHIYNNNILELGSGTGVLTNEIIKFNPKSITGIEIDNSLLNKAINKKIIILNENIKKIDFKNYKDYLCISAPPYSLIKNIHEDLNRMQFVLIVSPKYFCYFSNFKIIGEIKADMFTPISKKNHFVITNLTQENF